MNVQSFPYIPDMVAIAHAIAEGAGEPSAVVILAASRDSAAQGKAMLAMLLGQWCMLCAQLVAACTVHIVVP